MEEGGIEWYSGCIYCRLKQIGVGSLAIVMPLGGPDWCGEVVVILGVVGVTVGGHEVYRVYGRCIGEGRLIGYSLDVVYGVVGD